MLKLKQIKLHISEDLSGREIKSILFGKYKMSSSLVKELKQTANGIMLNSERVTVRNRVKCGDILEINITEGRSENIVPNSIPIDIIYENEDILAVNKPCNMPMHPSVHHYENTLANAVVNYYQNTDFVFRAVSRLDKDTTGVVVIAKNKYSSEILSRQMRERDIVKKYLAVCCGVPNPRYGTIEVPIGRQDNSIIKRIVSKDGQYAKTDYEVIKTVGDISLVSLTPHTGRTHQLRVHMAYIGCPLYGDFAYGTEIPGERTRLHCSSLEFTNPQDGKRLTLTAPMPKDFLLTNF